MELGLTRTRTLALCFTIILVLVFLGNVEGNEDSEALIAVKNSLVDPNNNVFQSWDSGADPCSWFHIQCNKDNRVSRIDLGNGNLSGILVPQIAQLSYLERLSLYNNNISGRIPDELGDLTNLDSLELYSNKFTGSIPETLGKLHKLQYLRLNNNNLTGEIPISLTTIKSLKILELSYNNLRGPIPVNGSFSKFTPQSFFPNKFNSTIGSSPSASNHTSGNGAVVAIAGGVAAGAALLIGALCIAVVLWRRRQRKIRFFDIPAEECPEAQLGQLKKFSLSELQIATDNFSNKNILGRGGFGKVYKGRLTDGCLVAVKRLKDEANYAGEMQFQSELEIIGMAVHRNLLRLRGFCMTPTERMLVYPYMVNGSVASCLKERPKSRPPLSWSIRKKIAFGAAKGLAYLHDHCNPKIIHRDVKAANILLDEQFEAVVGDFGLAKLMDFKDTHVTTDVKGTIGHIAPEYLSNGRSSEKTDVFGYGVMLLELITGQRTFYLAQLADDNNAMLLEWVKRLVNEKKLDTLIDSDLEDSYVKEEVEQLIQVALLCTQGSPTERPKMSEVVRMLEADNGLVERWEEWQKMDMPCQEINSMYSPNIDSTYNLCPEELSGPR